jgi:hypothetical protein
LERNRGGILILDGKYMGDFIPISDSGEGAVPNIGVNASLMRIDAFGPQVGRSSFQGERTAISGNLNLPFGFSIGLAGFMSDYDESGTLFGYGIQGGWGVSVLPASITQGETRIQ